MTPPENGQPQPESTPAATDCHVLLVEDNPDHRELICTGLRDCHGDINIVNVNDGEQALAYLRRTGEYGDPQRSPRPQVVLLDLRMPKVDGLEVIRQLKTSEELKRIPVVVLTTSKAKIDVAKAYDYHANSYLLKPEEYSELQELLTSLSDYWLQRNQEPISLHDDRG